MVQTGGKAMTRSQKFILYGSRLIFAAVGLVFFGIYRTWGEVSFKTEITFADIHIEDKVAFVLIVVSGILILTGLWFAKRDGE